MDRSARISESFKARADSSAYWEAWVGARLARMNLWTKHWPVTLADELGVPLSHYAHSWDLDVSANGTVFTPVEVKSINLSFLDPKDYPHQGVLVCSDASWRKKWGMQDTLKRDFLIVSRVTGGIVWLPKGASCGLTRVTDKTRGETYMARSTHVSNLQPLVAFADHVKAS